jgi:murein tripeptide amidase MpaA
MFIRRLVRSLIASIALAGALISHAQQLANVGELGPFITDGQPQKVVRVRLTTQEQLDEVLTFAQPFSCHVGVGEVDLRVDHFGHDRLKQLNVVERVLIDDVQAAVEAQWDEATALQPAGGVSWFAAYKQYSEIDTKLTTYTTLYPTLVTRFSAGTSIENRSIYAVRVSVPDSPSNPRTQRPVVIIHAGQHAREWIAPMTAMWTLDALVTGYSSDPRITRLMNSFEFIIVPVANPDGYVFTWANPNNRLWRKNRRPNTGGSFGVDTNRNWDFQFVGTGSSATPSNDTHRGTSGFSEPETRALRDLYLNNPRAITAIDIHSYSQLVLAPWGYTAATSPRAVQYANLVARVRAAILSVNNVVYTGGPIAQVLYIANGSSTDWSFGTRNMLSLACELRDTGTTGFLLPAAQIVPTAQEFFAGFLTQVEYVTSGCVRADVATLGGAAGPDGQVTIDDLIYFIGAFFANNTAVADVVGLGGSAVLDGNVTADDLIAYLALFFGGCP